MADGDSLPNDHNAARYCAPRDIGRDGWISSTAFKPRDIDPGGLVSVTHVECFGKVTFEENVTATIATLRKTVRGYQSDGKVVILKVEDIASTSTTSNPVRVTEKPTRNNTCHAVVSGLADLLAAENLATVANKSDVRPA